MNFFESVEIFVVQICPHFGLAELIFDVKYSKLTLLALGAFPNRHSKNQPMSASALVR